MNPRDVYTRLGRLERLLAGLPEEANALWDDLRAVKQHLQQQKTERALLEQEAGALREELARCAGELGEAERRGTRTAGQLVAIRRLQSTLDRSQMLLALEEVAASLVGCEELALFELAGNELRLVHSVGIDAAALEALRLVDGVARHCEAAGGPWNDEARGAVDRNEPRLTACVPLQVDGRCVGALALFRLLEHKQQLEQPDIEMLELLGAHVGVALVATNGGAGRAA
jgi:GAF domain-containing protein